MEVFLLPGAAFLAGLAGLPQYLVCRAGLASERLMPQAGHNRGRKSV